MLEGDDNEDMYVTKRNGQLEMVSFDKILERIKKVGKEANIKINYTTLAMKVIDQLYNKISTTKMDELTAEQCASMSSVHPDYNILAGRITISNHHKNTSASFYEVMELLYSHDMISDILWLAVTHFGKEKLDQLCDYSRDYLIDYFGFKTLERAYLMNIHKKLVERPQHMWLRVALGIHGFDWDRIVETYHCMSQKYFTHATPTLFNAGTPHPQLSSCYLLAMEEDSIDGIFNTLKDCALISKWAGGIGLHIHNVRATGSHIRGTNGSSNGIVPMLKVFNNTAKYVDQGGGKRNGSFAIYLEPWHADVEMFLQMRKNHGDEELKARDLFYALWVPDLFMQRVKDGGSWTLMCPSECPGLSDVYGSEFVELYTKYESENKGRHTIPARDLWFQILDAQMETGTPYLLFKDAANEKSNQKNVGTIKSSNLCVAPETLVLTDAGHFPICCLWAGNYSAEESKKYQKVNVWNGQRFVPVTVVKTGENQPLIKVHTSDGMSLSCTPYHKFFVVDEETGLVVLKAARDLLPGDLLETGEYPIIENKQEETEDFIASGFSAGCQSGIDNLCMVNEKILERPLFVPTEDSSLRFKLEWFAGFIEPYMELLEEDQDLQVPSVSKYFLRDIKLMLQTCGINTVVRFFTEKEKEMFEKEAVLIISRIQLQHLISIGLKFSMNFPKLTTMNNDLHPAIRVTRVLPGDRLDDTYCFHEPIHHVGIFNGIRTSQCTEIIEYSDEKETAVCNLASIALPAFFNSTNRTFDFAKLHEITKIVTSNLNKIIDVNFYPTEKTERSNKRHRPIGIGVQGLADVFFLHGWSFTSAEAKQLNKDIFETIYHAALEKSNEIAQTDGAYETFAGSPASQGLLQFDLWGIDPGQTRYDWESLKDNIIGHGLRNSLLLAPMPTASTSQILGYNECIEPITSNIYSRRTMAGEFIMVNKYLMNELIEMDLWNETLKNQIIANNGSVQDLGLSQELRDKYRTVWEMPMKDLIDMAADRGAFICQSQSLNLWMEDPNYNSMTSMHFYSWSKGLKTGIYYLRRRPRHQAQQFTIEPKQNKSKKEDICEMCSA
jgi:ribonucleotide reductase alpha subunit